MKKCTIFLLLLIQVIGSAQNNTIASNLGFEDKFSNAQLPENWVKWGKYNISSDTITFHSGKQSLLITAIENEGTFGGVAYKIPSKYKGRKVTLEGYMKIENAENGYAGLLLRIDKDGKSVAFNNMSKQKIQGTKDWEKYSIKVNYPKNADEIYISGILVGKGKAWFDDFTVKIDNEYLENKKQIEPKLNKIDADNEFNLSSSFAINNPTATQIQNLYVLCKVWGLAKYHHPEIAKGNKNWDCELFRIIKKIDALNFQEAVVEWIKKQGKVKSKKNAYIEEENTKLIPNTQWIEDSSLITKDLSKILVELNRSTNGKNYYVSFYPGVKNPNFDTEKTYYKMKWDDAGYRLLSLFRYWNIIEYYYPNKHLIDGNWDNILREFIPKFIACNDELSYKLTVLELIGKITDTHANIWGGDKKLNTFVGERIVPVEIKYIENQFVVTKLYDEFDKNQKLAIGDIILKVDGVAVTEYVAKNKKYCPASNEPTQYRDLSNKLVRTNNTNLKITYLNNGQIVASEFKTIENKYWVNPTPAFKEITSDIGYIYPASLKKGEINNIMKSFQNKKGIVIDFRCYPSDFILFSLGKILMPEKIDFVKFSSGSIKIPGLFKYTKTTTVGSSNSNYYKGKVVILVNEETQSSAEYHTMALRKAPKATVIGSTTAGADGNVSKIYLPGNILTMISGIGVYYPDGTETQRVGIVPDILSKPTIKGIREGKDEVLEKAIDVINQN